MQSIITTFDNTAEGWERSLYAFLAEKERRLGAIARPLEPTNRPVSPTIPYLC
jgi:hypothetical protein